MHSRSGVRANRQELTEEERDRVADDVVDRLKQRRSLAAFRGFATAWKRTFDMNRLLIVGILIISTASLCAQTQPDPVKLKADAQRVVSSIKGDKAKIQVYCEIDDLGEQIGEADQKKDYKKVEALFAAGHRIGEKAWSRIR